MSSDWLLKPGKSRQLTSDVILYDRTQEAAVAEAKDVAKRWDCEVEVYVLRQTHIIQKPRRLEPEISEVGR